METYTNGRDTISLRQREHNPNLWEMIRDGEWIGAADYHNILVTKLERNGFHAVVETPEALATEEPKSFAVLGKCVKHTGTSFHSWFTLSGSFTDLESAKQHAMNIVQNGIYHSSKVMEPTFGKPDQMVYEFTPATIFSYAR